MSVNSVPGHHISKHLTSLLIFQFTRSYPHYCTTAVPEPLSPSPSCRGIATPGTSPGLRACLWSWPGVHLECRLQVLVPEHFLHQLRINFHLDQDRSERPPESVKSEGAQRGHDFRLVCGHAQVIGDQHVGRRPLPAFEANCAIDALAPLCPICRT